MMVPQAVRRKEAPQRQRTGLAPPRGASNTETDLE